MGRIESVAIGSVIVAGVALFGFGAVTGSGATYWIEVVDQVSQDELEESADVLEYDYLEPSIQDAFRKSIETGEDVRISHQPENFWDGYIHYRGSYYSTEIAVADAGQTTMVLSIGAGSVLVLAGVGAWSVLRRRNRTESSG